MYRLIVTVCLLCISLPCSASAWSEPHSGGAMGNEGFFSLLQTDFKNYYSSSSVKTMGMTVGLAGLLANSGADDDFRELVQNHLRSDDSNHQSDIWRQLGERKTSLTLYLGAGALIGLSGDTQPANALAAWGTRSLRGFFLGGPQHIMLAGLTGAGRPTEGNAQWWSFDDNNGVSGHAFFGALPLITAAQLSEDPWLRYSLYAASALPGLSRINDDKHFLSQVILGWSIAYLSADAVRRTDTGDRRDETDRGPEIRFYGTAVTVEWKF
ncbi:MAG: phosphatase PAP2 family protein [Pseudomonadota bacterium]